MAQPLTLDRKTHTDMHCTKCLSKQSIPKSRSVPKNTLYMNSLLETSDAELCGKFDWHIPIASS